MEISKKKNLCQQTPLMMTSPVLYLPDNLTPQSQVLHFSWSTAIFSRHRRWWQQSPKPSAHNLHCLLGETLQWTSSTGITPWSTSLWSEQMWALVEETVRLMRIQDEWKCVCKCQKEKTECGLEAWPAVIVKGTTCSQSNDGPPVALPYKHALLIFQRPCQEVRNLEQGQGHPLPCSS